MGCPFRQETRRCYNVGEESLDRHAASGVTAHEDWGQMSNWPVDDWRNGPDGVGAANFRNTSEEPIELIVSASRRTDIPAFFSEWFMERVRLGYCVVKNPFNPRQEFRVSLKPEDATVLVFWTKNPRPIMKYLDELDERGFRYYFHFTLNGYPPLIEPGLPSFEGLLESYYELSERLDPERVIWRYDPILFTQVTPVSYHEEKFAQLATSLRARTKRAIVSSFRPYRSAVRRLRTLGLDPVHDETYLDVARLMASLKRVAFENGMDIFSCADTGVFRQHGIPSGKCIDDDYLVRTFGDEIKDRISHRKDKSQRAECNCVESKDIGTYDTCRHGCLYCYARG